MTVCRALKIDAAPVLAQLPQLGGKGLAAVTGGLNAPFRDRPGRAEPADFSPVRHPLSWAALAVLVAAAAVFLLPAGWWERTLARQRARRRACTVVGARAGGRAGRRQPLGSGRRGASIDGSVGDSAQHAGRGRCRSARRRRRRSRWCIRCRVPRPAPAPPPTAPAAGRAARHRCHLGRGGRCRRPGAGAAAAAARRKPVA